MKRCLISFAFALLYSVCINSQVLTPVNIGNRQNISAIKLTDIGRFGLVRKARKTVPEHLHTGIDIKRPQNNYENEPIFAITKGIVISIRNDGPYAQIIIEHKINGLKFWTLYEHIAGVKVKLNDIVYPATAIARFMNKVELNRFGWQFDHFHFEVLKIKPVQLAFNSKFPNRRFSPYSLVCFNLEDLNKYYFDPLFFLRINSQSE